MFQAGVPPARAGSTPVPDRTAGKGMKSNPLILCEVILTCNIPLWFNRSLPGMESEETLKLICPE